MVFRSLAYSVSQGGTNNPPPRREIMEVVGWKTKFMTMDLDWRDVKVHASLADAETFAAANNRRIVVDDTPIYRKARKKASKS